MWCWVPVDTHRYCVLSPEMAMRQTAAPQGERGIIHKLKNRIYRPICGYAHIRKTKKFSWEGYISKPEIQDLDLRKNFCHIGVPRKRYPYPL